MQTCPCSCNSQGACYLCSHPWATCLPGMSQDPFPKIWALLKFLLGELLLLIQSSKRWPSFLVGTLFSGPWWVLPQVGTSKWIRGAAFSLWKIANPVVSCGKPQEPLSLVCKKEQRPSRTLPRAAGICWLWIWKEGRKKDGRGLYVALESHLLLLNLLCMMVYFWGCFLAPENPSGNVGKASLHFGAWFSVVNWLLELSLENS